MTDLCPAWVKPIEWSTKDTEATQREIIKHDLKYEENCHPNE